MSTASDPQTGQRPCVSSSISEEQSKQVHKLEMKGLAMTISLSVTDYAPASHIAFSIVPAQAMRLIVRELKPVPRSAIHARVLIALEYALAEGSHVLAKEPHIGRTIEARTNHTARIEEVRILGESFVFVSPAHLLFPG